MAKDEYTTGKPKPLGKYEYPKKLEILPAAPGKEPIGWTTREYIGTELRKAPPEDQMPLDWDAWHSFMNDKANVWSLDDPPPKEGDRALIQGLLGMALSTVDAGGLQVSTGQSVWPLTKSTELEGDDRNSWVTTCGYNKKVLDRFERFMPKKRADNDEENGDTPEAP